MEIVKLGLGEIVPYENNPRHNEFAVPAVAESIRQCGYVAPIIVDEDHVILAGHTRLMALERLGYGEADCIVISGLSDEQKRKFRILDNKTGELAEWDEDLLRGELENLNLGAFTWFDDIINPNIKLEADGSPKQEDDDGDDEDDGLIRCPRCGAIVDGEEMGDDEDGDEYGD